MLKARRSARRKRGAPTCLVKSQRMPAVFPKAVQMWRASRTVDEGPQAPYWTQTRSATLWWPCQISFVHPAEIHIGSQHPESRMTTPRPLLRSGNRPGRNARHRTGSPAANNEGHDDHEKGHVPNADPAVQGAARGRRTLSSRRGDVSWCVASGSRAAGPHEPGPAFPVPTLGGFPLNKSPTVSRFPLSSSACSL